ncbi:zinc finger and BTB domain-containing protein 7C-like isoform X1 [Dermacentor albipictus]|uniref:zinc finger and BTB domain-containing protein 7C-like isoform X1 n=1 Tax=Dermacentor albipictus TaxID=60249 RepID=UPI0038FC90F9
MWTEPWSHPAKKRLLAHENAGKPKLCTVSAVTEAWAAHENLWTIKAEASDDSSSGVRSPPSPPWSRVSGVWRCNRCLYTAPDIYRIKRHQVTHTGERRYYCPICQARFTAKQSVKIHMRRHTGERPYACNLCPARFTRQQRLARHMETCGSTSFEQAV